MEKLYTSIAFLKMAGGRMHAPHPTPLYPPLAMSYRNHQKSLAYFSHLAPLILFFLLIAQSKGGGPGPMPPSKYVPARAGQIRNSVVSGYPPHRCLCRAGCLGTIKRGNAHGVGRAVTALDSGASFADSMLNQIIFHELSYRWQLCGLK